MLYLIHFNVKKHLCFLQYMQYILMSLYVMGLMKSRDCKRNCKRGCTTMVTRPLSKKTSNTYDKIICIVCNYI